MEARDPAAASAFRTVAGERGRLQVSVETAGTRQPATRVEIGSRVSGQLLRVLTVDNSEALLPSGMTATVTIQGALIDDALIVPAAALRCVPSTLGGTSAGDGRWGRRHRRDRPCQLSVMACQ